MLIIFSKVLIFIFSGLIIMVLISFFSDINTLMIFNSVFLLFLALLFQLIFFRNFKKLNFINPKFIYLPIFLILIILLIPFLEFSGIISEYIFNRISFINTNTDNFENLMLSIITNNNVVYNIFIVSFLPALCEEILFRGTIQRLISEKLNIHLSIFITSVIFATIHFNTKTIIPIIFISVILGYSFYYGKSLAIPISIHFINNLISLINLYIKREEFFSLENYNITWVLFSIISSFLFLFLLKRKLIL